MAKYDLTQFQLKKADVIAVYENDTKKLFQLRKEGTKWFCEKCKKTFTSLKVINFLNDFMHREDMQQHNYDVEVRCGGKVWFCVNGHKGTRSKKLN